MATERAECRALTCEFFGSPDTEGYCSACYRNRDKLPATTEEANRLREEAKMKREAEIEAHRVALRATAVSDAVADELVASVTTADADTVRPPWVEDLVSDKRLTAAQAMRLARAVHAVLHGEGAAIDAGATVSSGTEAFSGEYRLGHEIYSRVVDPHALEYCGDLPWHGTVGYYQSEDPLFTPEFRSFSG